MMRNCKFDLTNIFQIIYFIKPLKGLFYVLNLLSPHDLATGR
jgi:hypothetical protein